jgi:hypothetical protein
MRGRWLASHPGTPGMAGCESKGIADDECKYAPLVVIAGGAVIVLTTVVGFGCYTFLRDLFGKPPTQLDARR